MTPEDLQDELVLVLAKIFDDKIGYQTPSGKRRTPRIYRQDVPVQQRNETDDEAADAEGQAVPYIIIRVSDGTFESWNEALTVTVILIFCAYDSGGERQGTRDLMQMMQKVFRRFATNPSTGNFTCQVPIEWAIQEEVDTFPYYFSAMELKFACPGAVIEDPLA